MASRSLEAAIGSGTAQYAPPSRIYFSIRASQSTVNHYQAALVSPRQVSPTNGWPRRVITPTAPTGPFRQPGPSVVGFTEVCARGVQGTRTALGVPAQWPGPRSGDPTTSVPSCWLSRCQGQQLSPRLRKAAASRRAGRRRGPKHDHGACSRHHGPRQDPGCIGAAGGRDVPREGTDQRQLTRRA